MQALDEHDAPEELQPLLHAMNELLAKEIIAVDKHRRFLANAAHQLKTPLAGLKVQADAALREKDLAHVQHALKQISNGSENLARLANQLLSLARVEPESGMDQKLEQLDLVALVHKVSMDWVPKALDKNIDLGVKCQPNTLMINGNTLFLQELLNNLIDNAIRYNQPGAIITVGLNLRKNEAVLSVQDDGVGIAIKDQEKVFERFYRVFGSNENGCGLGLAIVREIANQHQASVALGYSDIKHGRGTMVTVTFKSAND
jgi:two-component system sensor histidine kinase TctE